MNEKQIQKVKKEILLLQEKVATSKPEATKFLIDLGVLNKKGHLKREFKSLG